MTSVRISKEKMLQRVARFKEITPNTQAFVDSHLPGHQRENFRFIGKGVSEDPAHKPAVTAPHEFSVGGIRALPGNGAALHSHPTVEVFIAITGRWGVYWGDKGEEEVILDPLDMISVPPGVMRGFRNAGEEEGFLMTVIGGEDPGRVTWPAEILAQAGAQGVSLDSRGDLVSGL